MIPPCCAYHEAGHALVAEHVGIEVLSVVVTEQGGCVNRGLFYDLDRATWDAYPLMMAAGLGAELLYDPDADRAWRHTEGDRLILRNFGHSDDEIHRWGHESRDIIESQMAAWLRLAKFLAPGGTFAGAACREVMAGEHARDAC